jgi:hypothetical protein
MKPTQSAVFMASVYTGFAWPLAREKAALGFLDILEADCNVVASVCAGC